jgi:endonuclease/exonuclease/phosphatase (EEP) superfamily protein YafD
VTVLAICTALLSFVTVAAATRAKHWIFRIWDFPRSQLAFFAAVLLGFLIWRADFGRPLAWALAAITAGCLVCQVWWITPYTRLFPTEVARARHEDKRRAIRILAANVLQTNTHAERFLKLVRDNDPDVVVTLETNSWWQKQLEPLERDYPYRLQAPLENLYGMHLFSKLPLEDARVRYLVEDDKPSMHAIARLRSGERVELHCLHPAPPGPTENKESSERDAELIVVGKTVKHSKLPVIVTGDLNDVAWSETTRLFRHVSGLLDPRRGRGTFSTFPARWPISRWPLDHVFHSPALCLVDIHTLKNWGSDHLPIVYELALDPSHVASERSPRPSREDAREAEKTLAEARGSNRDGIHSQRGLDPGKAGGSLGRAARRRRAAPSLGARIRDARRDGGRGAQSDLRKWHGRS